jgi:predicted ABC-type ATPase
VRQRESFVFETVCSDPVGEKVGFLRRVAQSGYNTILCFIGIAGPPVSEQRVAMRVLEGGHDVPTEKLVQRFPRTLANLKLALRKCRECGYSTTTICEHLTAWSRWWKQGVSRCCGGPSRNGSRRC